MPRRGRFALPLQLITDIYVMAEMNSEADWELLGDATLFFDLKDGKDVLRDDMGENSRRSKKHANTR
jgi:hypothetical protein